MIKIEEIRPLYLVHSLAAIILVGTLGLLGYELSKPRIQRAEAASTAYKASALAELNPQPSITYRLPPLPERFQRKVIFSGFRRRTPKQTQPAKAYLALNKPQQTQALGGQ